MLADIVSGKTATADIFFLIAAILFAVAVLVSFLRTQPVPRLWESLMALASLFLALGWWVL